MIPEPVSARRAEATPPAPVAARAPDSPSPARRTTTEEPFDGAQGRPFDSAQGRGGQERFAERAAAIVEVVLCSGFPTQLLLIYTFAALGFRPYVEGRMSLGYVTTLALGDATLMLGLIALFLRAHGEAPRQMLLGARSRAREALIGVALIVPIFALVVGVLTLVKVVAPALHNVDRNPLEELLTTPGHAAVVALVAVAAGGVREEIQRAFVLRRFERSLGGGWVGVGIFSLVFGAGHTIQGWDAAIATAILGALWGVIYLQRRSVLVPLVSHSGFNVAEIVRYSVFG